MSYSEQREMSQIRQTPIGMRGTCRPLQSLALSCRDNFLTLSLIINYRFLFIYLFSTFQHVVYQAQNGQYAEVRAWTNQQIHTKQNLPELLRKCRELPCGQYHRQ